MEKFDPTKVPQELKALPNWLTWRFERVKGRDDPTKVPVSIRTGRKVSAYNTDHQGSIEEAMSAAKKFKADGVGFSFVENGFIGIDFDDCIIDGELHPSVAELVVGIGYVEVSPSGEGIKAFVRANIDLDKPNRVVNFPVDGIETEAYSEKRYFTVTSHRLESLSTKTLIEQTDRVQALHNRMKAHIAPKSEPKKAEAKEEEPVELDDRQLLEVAFRSKNGSDIEALYSGDWKSRYRSQSQADQALCNHLAFYTGKDADRIDRLFRGSKLYRKKWDKKHVRGRTYGAETISQALAITSDVYTPPKPRTKKDEPESPWPAPVPLDSSRTPDWPEGLLPESLESFTDAVSEMNQTPRAQAKMMSIPVLSAAAQGLYQVEVNGRTENLATFVCVAASTGERKSSDIRLVKAPLVAFEMESHRLTLERQRKDTYEIEILAELVEKLKRKAANTGADSEKEAYFAARAKLDSLGSITAKTLLAQDITPEKLAGLMSEQGESIAIMSAEGGPLENIKSRYQKASSVSPIYMEGFSGEEVIVHRKRSEYGDIKLFNPSLTMGIMTQPGHLASILVDRDFTGRGLLERFLWCLANERIGYRGRGKAMPSEMVTRYHEAMRGILAEPGYRKSGADRKRRTLQIGAEGLSHLFDFSERLEPRFRPGGDLREVRGWASRLPTAVVKLASLWHIYASAERAEDVAGIVSTRWVKVALRWVEEFAIPMGLKTFGIMGSDAGVDLARRILEEIRENGYCEFRKSEFKDRHFKTIPAKEVKDGYEALVERGYIRRKKLKTDGRTATVFEVNPIVFEGSEKNGEEVEKREKKGPEREENLQNLLSPYKGVLDPFSLTKETDNDTICPIPDSSSGKKGKKGKKVPDRVEEPLLFDDLLDLEGAS